MNDHGTPRKMPIIGLMFGDRFRFEGDPEGVCYAPVRRTQQYGDSHFVVDLVDGASHYSVITRQVVLLHRAPDCACGVHVDLCEADCAWPDELEDLWHSVFRGRLA